MAPELVGRFRRIVSSRFARRVKTIMPRRERRRNRRKAAWDAICSRCGLCCYQKRYRHGRLLIDLSSPCTFLDTETNRCTVYDDRFRACPDCKKVTLYHALFSSFMPKTCAYVKKYRKFGFLISNPRIYDPRQPK